MPEGEVSRLANHVTVQVRSRTDGSDVSVAVNFWQAPGYIDDDDGKVAVLLGSYVMSPAFAEDMVGVLARSLGCRVVKEEGADAE